MWLLRGRLATILMPWHDTPPQHQGSCVAITTTQVQVQLVVAPRAAASTFCSRVCLYLVFVIDPHLILLLGRNSQRICEYNAVLATEPKAS